MGLNICSLSRFDPPKSPVHHFFLADRSFESDDHRVKVLNPFSEMKGF